MLLLEGSCVKEDLKAAGKSENHGKGCFNTKFKHILIGDLNIGDKITKGHFTGQYRMHAHSSFSVPTLINILLNIRDTAGQEKFGVLRDSNCSEE